MGEAGRPREGESTAPLAVSIVTSFMLIVTIKPSIYARDPFTISSLFFGENRGMKLGTTWLRHNCLLLYQLLMKPLLI